MKNTIPILIIILTIIILVQALFLYNKQPETVVDNNVIVTDTSYVEIPKEIIKYIPKKEIVEVPIYIEDNIDTLSILKEYYSVYFYSDTVNVLTYGNIIIQDTLTKNNIVFREIIPNLTIPVITTVITNNVYTKSKSHYYIGAQVGVDLFAPTAYFQDKKGSLYGVGVNLYDKKAYFSISMKLK
jgi:hypothetical protein